jgi:hypothetical protein
LTSKKAVGVFVRFFVAAAHVCVCERSVYCTGESPSVILFTRCAWTGGLLCMIRVTWLQHLPDLISQGPLMPLSAAGARGPQWARHPQRLP